ncbi:MAG: hypothetical protein CVV39_08255 [Planctomycetes bacterium HGW-Planctomycetes-1]|nr:MAG: hypothetical protein CVV39_08255 [Planctomycetes bacterium HGW-Planctomycetes-1]
MPTAKRLGPNTKKKAKTLVLIYFPAIKLPGFLQPTPHKRVQNKKCRTNFVQTVLEMKVNTSKPRKIF